MDTDLGEGGVLEELGRIRLGETIIRIYEKNLFNKRKISNLYVGKTKCPYLVYTVFHTC